MPKTSTKSQSPTILSDAELMESAHPQAVEIYRPDDRDLRLLMDRAVTEGDWHNIFVKAREIALSGGQVGIKAMEFLAKYRFGLPAQMTRDDGEKQKPIQVIEIYKGNAPPEQIENKAKPVEDGDTPF